MDQSLQLLVENLVSMARGALMMMLIVVCVKLYPRRKKSSIHTFLFCLLIVLLLLLVVSFGFMLPELNQNKQFHIFNTLLDLCLIPLFGTYLLKIVLPDCINLRRILFIQVPTVTFAVLYLFTHNEIMLTLSVTYTACVAVITSIVIFFISVRYNRFLKNNFSDIDYKTVGWVRNILIAFITWYLVWSFVLVQANVWFDLLYYLFLIVIWILIYQHSTKHVVAFSTEEMFIQSEKEENEIAQNALVIERIGKTLEQYMEEKRPWLNLSLSLQDLAVALNTNRTYLSKYFNQILGTTFYDYLNTFRIKYASEVLLSEPTLSIQQVGEKSGFNTLATFRTTFEKHFGCTPAQYRKKDGVV